MMAKADGSTGDFEQLVRLHTASMLALARSIVGMAIADEVVQEAWLKAYQALSRFEGRASIRTWLMTITANEAKSRLRKESRQIPLDAGHDDDAAFGQRLNAQGGWTVPPRPWHDDRPEALLTHEEMRDCIEQTLDQLPQMQQAAFLLKEIEGNSYDEICKILGLGASNARVLIHRARTALVARIDHFQETGEC